MDTSTFTSTPQFEAIVEYLSKNGYVLNYMDIGNCRYILTEFFVVRFIQQGSAIIFSRFGYSVSGMENIIKEIDDKIKKNEV